MQEDIHHWFLPCSGKLQGGGDTIALGEASLAVNCVPPSADLPTAFAVVWITDDDIAAILEPMRNAAGVSLAITQPFCKGRLQ
jgi:hypothetical protein